MRKISLSIAALLACSAQAVAQNYPYQATSTDQSGTITTGGTFQNWLAPNGGRVGCALENPTTASEVLLVHVRAKGQTLASATTANSFTVAAGGYWFCNQAGVLLTDAVDISAATTAHAFTGTSQ